MRNIPDDLRYSVNGLDGAGRYHVGKPDKGSKVRYRDQHGAMLIEERAERIKFKFVKRSGKTIDTYQMSKPCSAGRR